MIVAIANIVVLFAVAWMLAKKESVVIRKFFWAGLVVKILAGIALGLLYTYYYHIGDTFSYFDDACDIAHLVRTSVKAYADFIWNNTSSFEFWDQLNFNHPRALFLSKMTSVFCMLTGDNYWVISIYFSFVGFYAAWFLVKVITRFDEHLLKISLLAFVFFPSVALWSSGLIKESLAMGSLYFIVAIFLKIWLRVRTSIIQWVLLPVAFLLLWNLKYYYVAVLLPVLATALVFHWLIYPRIRFKNYGLECLVWLVVFLIPLFVASQVHPNFYPERFLDVIVSNYDAFREKSDPDDMIHYHGLEATATSVVYHAPKALLSGMFRPFLWEGQNVFQFLIALENAIVLLLFVTSLSKLRRVFHSPHHLLIFSSIVYIFLLCIFLALSTPNFGTLARYRVGFLPFLILLISAYNPFLYRLKSFLERTFSTLGRE